MLSKIILYSAICVAFVIANTGCTPSESYFRSKVVQLTGNNYSCSGEQVVAKSGKSYILTAGHCKELIESGRMAATTDDGKHYSLKVIKEDYRSDLLLLEGIPKVQGLIVAATAERKDKVMTYTHGRAHATYRTDGELLETVELSIPVNSISNAEDMDACQKMPKTQAIMQMDMFGELDYVCALVVKETFSTAMTVPGSSGGMVVNMKGQLVGVVSAGDGSFSAFVPLKDIQRFLAGF